MASIRNRSRADGGEYFQVLYRHAGKQTSMSFDDFTSAQKFCGLVNKFGPDNALEALSVEAATGSAMTLNQ